MNTKEKKSFSLAARARSFNYAFRGMYLFVANTHNAWVELFGGFVALALGVWFRIGPVEWLAVLISFGMLFMAEAFNAAMEVHMDLTSPGRHPSARDTKDIAAGAVLVAVVVFLAVCAIVFLPYLFALFHSGASIGPRYA